MTNSSVTVRRRVSWLHIAMFALSVLVGGCGTGSPKLEFAAENIDLGAIAADGGQFAITVRNLGSSKLRISSVSSSCSCTVVNSATSIGPQSEGQIDLRMSYVAPGRGSARVAVESNDPGGIRTVNVTWFGLHPPKLDPPSMSVRGLQPGKPFSREFFVIYAGGDKEARCIFEQSKGSVLGSVRFKEDALTERMNMASASNEIAIVGKLTFSFEGNAPSAPGTYSDIQVISVKQFGKSYELALPIIFNVAGPLELIPQSVDAAITSNIRWDNFRKSIIVRSSEQSNISISYHPPSLKCSMKRLESKGPGTTTLLEIAGIGDPPNFPFKGAVTLSCQAGGKSTDLSLPININLLK